MTNWRECSLCCVPVAGPGCRHIEILDGRVVMSTEEHERLVERLTTGIVEYKQLFDLIEDLLWNWDPRHETLISVVDRLVTELVKARCIRLSE